MVGWLHVVATIHQIYQIEASKMLVHFTLTWSSVVHVDDCMSFELWLAFVLFQSTLFARTEGEHAF